MDGILSGFPFSRKKGAAEPSSNKKSHDPDINIDRNSDRNTDINTDRNRSNAMRLSSNESAQPFSSEKTFGSSTATTHTDENRVTEIARNKATPTAVIGPKITFKGELSGEEDLLILGYVEGSIDLKGNHLTIGSQGVIKANVIARTITVEGSVEGDIVASEHIAIKSASQVKGNLKAERVTLEDGAKFRGSIEMDMETTSKTEHKSSISIPAASTPFVQDKKLDTAE